VYFEAIKRKKQCKRKRKRTKGGREERSEERGEGDKQKAKEYVETMAEYRKNAINYHKK